MPKNGDVIRGQFQEIINPHIPCKWDDPPTYFNVPTQTAPALPVEDEAARITKAFATAAKPQMARASQARRAAWPSNYFSDQIKRINAESEK